MKIGNPFYKNVSILLSGTALSQLAPLIFSPVLARMYSPLEFGVFGFISGSSILTTTFATFRLQDILTLPADDKKANILLKAALLNLFIFSLLTLIVISLFVNDLNRFFNLTSSHFSIYFFPVVLFFQGSYPIFDAWNNREKKYKIIGIGQFIRTWVLIILSTVFGFFFSTTYGLLLGFSLSLLFLFIFQIVTLEGEFGIREFSISNLKIVFFEYKNLILTLIVSEGIGSIFGNLHYGFITKQFGADFFGYYTQASKIMETPSKAISNAIGIVYKKEAIDAYNKNGYFNNIFIATFKKLVFLFTIPYLIFYFISEDLIIFLWGKEWAASIDLVKIMIFSSYFSFIFSPIDKSALIKQKNLYYFFWHLLRLSLLTLIIFSSKNYEINGKIYIICYTALICFMLLLDFIFEYFFSLKDK